MGARPMKRLKIHQNDTSNISKSTRTILDKVHLVPINTVKSIDTSAAITLKTDKKDTTDISTTIDKQEEIVTEKSVLLPKHHVGLVAAYQSSSDTEDNV